MRKGSAKKGMTLIEILIALIVMVLGILGIMALFPPALQSGNESVEETNAAIIAESVAHGLVQAFQSAEENKTSASLQLRATLAHDLNAPPAIGRYTFILPPLPQNPMVDPDWYHFPSSKSPSGQGGSPAPGDPGSKMVGSYDAETDDRHFQLGGDQWLLNTVKDVQKVNDPTDPLTQFAFSFDIRKVDDMYYQRRDPKAVDPIRGVVLKADEYEGMAKLYEVRIHILRIVHEGASGGGDGAVYRHYITSFIKRISVK